MIIVISVWSNASVQSFRRFCEVPYLPCIYRNPTKMNWSKMDTIFVTSPQMNHLCEPQWKKIPWDRSRKKWNRASTLLAEQTLKSGGKMTDESVFPSGSPWSFERIQTSVGYGNGHKIQSRYSPYVVTAISERVDNKVVTFVIILQKSFLWGDDFTVKTRVITNHAWMV